MAVDNVVDETEEYYASSDELLREDDIIETDIKILGWRKKFRVRALTFAQMEKINKNATDKDGIMNSELFVYWTIVEGVIRPRFKIDQAMRLAESNGAFVQELSDEIWRLGRVSKKLWDEFLEEAKHRNKLDKGDFRDEVQPEDTK